VALGSIIFGRSAVFIFPRFTAGYLGRASMQPSLMTGFSDDVELGQIRRNQKESQVVMRVKTASQWDTLCCAGAERAALT